MVSFIRLEEGREIFTVCQNGSGKRTPFDDYRLTKRGGKGVKNINTEKNGDVVASLSVVDGDEVLLMSRNGMVVRIGLEDVRSMGRSAAGVRVIRIDDGDQLTGAAICPTSDEDEEGEE